MSEAPVELIVAAFKDKGAAESVLKELKAARKAHLIGIENAAVIVKDDNGKVHIKEMGDMGGGQGAVVGGVLGAVVGLIFPPSILLTGAIGAAVGGLAAKFVDAGFPNEQLKEIGESLTNGSSAILAIIEHRWVVEAERELQAAGAKVMMAEIKGDISKQLGEGRDVAYSVVDTGDSVSAQRVAAGEDQVQVSQIAASQEGVVGKSATITKDGAVDASAFVATAEGVVAANVSGKLEAPASQVEAPAESAPAATEEAPKPADGEPK
jgi:uncharacterized membrane protein